MDLKKLCLNKIFWSAISASFAFTIIMFNVAMDANTANGEEIRIIRQDINQEMHIIQDDIKQIVSDTSYIRGIIERNGDSPD